MSPAFFERDVSYRDERWFAVVLDNFWAAQDFPFEREETEKVLRSYEDAEGAIFLENVKTKFRKCGCLDDNGDRRVCVPPAPGYMCQRRATLVKMHIVLQRERVERFRQKREKIAIENAREVARQEARDFCDSDHGHFYDKAKKRAKKEMELRRQRQMELERDDKIQALSLKVRKEVEAERRGLLEKRRDHEKLLYEKLRQLEPLEDSLEGYALEKVQREIDDLLKLLADLPEDKALRDLDKSLETRLEETRQKTFPSKKKMNKREEEELAEELRVDLVKKYGEKQAAKAEKALREEHFKMRKIAASWAGLTVYDIFRNWRHFTQRQKRRRKADEWASRADELQKAADKAAAVALAKWHVSKFEEKTDIWSDRTFWQHVDTEERLWVKPEMRDFLPPNLSIPEELLQQEDLVTRTLEAQADVVRRRSNNDGALVLTEDDNNVLVADDGDTSSDSSDSATTSSGSKDDEQQHGLVSFAGALDDDDLSEEESQSSQSEDDPELLEWHKGDATLPAVRDVLELPPIEAKERRNNESIDAAMQRAHTRRKMILATYKDDEPKKRKKKDDGISDGEEEEEEDPLDVVSREIGFDPARDYTEVEMTLLARKAHKFNKRHGIKEDLTGAYEKTFLEKSIDKLLKRIKKTKKGIATTMATE